MPRLSQKDMGTFQGKKNVINQKGKNALKKTVSLLLCAVFLLCTLLCGCDDRPTHHGGKQEDILHVWVYSDEYKSAIDQAVATDLSGLDFKIVVEVVEAVSLDEKIEQTKGSSAAPDIIMLSPSNLVQYTRSDATAVLDGLGIVLDEGRYYDMVFESGRDDSGAMKAVCWQPDPGVFFYRRSLAKAYLGTDEPAEIQNMISTWDGFYQTAQKLRQNSGGKTCITAGPDDVMLAYLSCAGCSWMKDGKLSVSDKAFEFLEYAKKLADEKLVGNIEMWSPAWAMGISDTQSVFGYFSSMLGLEGVLKAACMGTAQGEGSFGDWACCAGPQPFNWGGCWFAVLADSDMKSEAAVFLEYFILEEEAMKRSALISSSFSSNITVVEAIKYDSQFIDPFLDGQNYYAVMASAAADIDMSSVSAYDSFINLAFADCAREYAFGYRTKDQAIDDFRTIVLNSYPELG